MPLFHFLRQRRWKEIEAAWGVPMYDLLYDLYHTQKLSTKKICRLLNTQPRSLLAWFKDLGIETRSLSEAVAMQWENNEERRKTLHHMRDARTPAEGPFHYTCQQCEAAFTSPTRRESLYCSRKCQHDANKTGTEKTCPYCKKQFYVKGSKDHRNYCSIHCWRKADVETSIERRTREALTAIGLQFEQEYPIGRYHIDFFLTECNIAIEVDGTYWHQGREDRDAKKDRFLRQHGIDVVRVSDTELKTGDPVRVVALKIKAVIEARQ